MLPGLALTGFLVSLSLMLPTASSSETSNCIRCHMDKDRLAQTLTAEPARKSELIEGVG